MRADLHVHTCYSEDGHTTLEELVDIARMRNLGCIAVTDHNSFEAYEHLKDIEDIIFVPGEEVSSAGGHIVALGIDRHIQSGLSIKETVDLIHEAGGIAIVAHPYRMWNGIGPENIIPEFDGIEAMNARSVPKDNRRSNKLAREFGKAITAGSDAHVPRKVGDGYVIIPDECRTWQDVIKVLKEGDVQVESKSRTILNTCIWGPVTFFKWTFRGFRNM